MKVLRTLWTTNKDGCIGFVLFEDFYGHKVIRVGRVTGNNIEDDIKHLRDWGGTLPYLEMATMLKTALEGE